MGRQRLADPGRGEHRWRSPAGDRHVQRGRRPLRPFRRDHGRAGNRLFRVLILQRGEPLRVRHGRGRRGGGVRLARRERRRPALHCLPLELRQLFVDVCAHGPDRNLLVRARPQREPVRHHRADAGSHDSRRRVARSQPDRERGVPGIDRRPGLVGGQHVHGPARTRTTTASTSWSSRTMPRSAACATTGRRSCSPGAAPRGACRRAFRTSTAIPSPSCSPPAPATVTTRSSTPPPAASNRSSRRSRSTTATSRRSTATTTAGSSCTSTSTTRRTSSPVTSGRRPATRPCSRTTIRSRASGTGTSAARTRSSSWNSRRTTCAFATCRARCSSAPRPTCRAGPA